MEKPPLLSGQHNAAPADKHKKKLWICKTNIASEKDLEHVGNRLNEHPAIIKWNIDREDSDRVLRVTTTVMELDELLALVRDGGYECEELPD